MIPVPPAPAQPAPSPTPTVERALSGKGHRDENFPVASWLIAARHRPTVLAFYRFARAADDVADHPDMPAEHKLDLLDRLAATLEERAEPAEPAAAPLAHALCARGLDAAHPLDLITAFRSDVTMPRQANWDALMAYCRYSAAPVGRFVLDVHGEDRALWPMNDALCAALQVINHLQDAKADLLALDRCYIPLDWLAAEGAEVEHLRNSRETPALRRVFGRMLAETTALLDHAAGFSRAIRDTRLALEVAVITALARALVDRLSRNDLLAGHVALSKPAMAAVAMGGVAHGLFARMAGRFR